MASYTITHKRDNTSGALEKVKLSTGNEKTKQQVIDDIGAKNTYKTIGGATVRVVNGASGKYLRTDANNTEEDNLENVSNY